MQERHKSYISNKLAARTLTCKLLVVLSVSVSAIISTSLCKLWSGEATSGTAALASNYHKATKKLAKKKPATKKLTKELLKKSTKPQPGHNQAARKQEPKQNSKELAYFKETNSPILSRQEVKQEDKGAAQLASSEKATDLKQYILDQLPLWLAGSALTMLLLVACLRFYRAFKKNPARVISEKIAEKEVKSPSKKASEGPASDNAEEAARKASADKARKLMIEAFLQKSIASEETRKTP